MCIRTEDCTLETIGIPVFKKYTPDQHGGWMMDPAPRDPEDYHKVREDHSALYSRALDLYLNIFMIYNEISGLDIGSGLI